MWIDDRLRLVALLAAFSLCQAKEFTFCINNESDDDWRVSGVWNLDEYDWKGSSSVWKGNSPGQFQGDTINARGERCHTLRTSAHAKSNPFNIRLERGNNAERVAFRVHNYEQSCSSPPQLEFSDKYPTVQPKLCRTKIVLSKNHARLCQHTTNDCVTAWEVIASLDNSKSRNTGTIKHSVIVGMTEGTSSTNTLENWQRFKETNSFNVNAGVKAGVEKEGISGDKSMGFGYSYSKEVADEFMQQFTSTIEQSKSYSETIEIEYSVNPFQNVILKRLVTKCQCFGYKSPRYYPFVQDFSPLCEQTSNECTVSYDTLDAEDNSKGNKSTIMTVNWKYGLTEGQNSTNTVANWKRFKASNDIDVDSSLRAGLRKLMEDGSVTREMREKFFEEFANATKADKGQKWTASRKKTVEAFHTMTAKQLSFKCQCFGFKSRTFYTQYYTQKRENRMCKQTSNQCTVSREVLMKLDNSFIRKPTNETIDYPSWIVEGLYSTNTLAGWEKFKNESKYDVYSIVKLNLEKAKLLKVLDDVEFDQMLKMFGTAANFTNGLTITTTTNIEVQPYQSVEVTRTSLMCQCFGFKNVEKHISRTSYAPLCQVKTNDWAMDWEEVGVVNNSLSNTSRNFTINFKRGLTEGLASKNTLENLDRFVKSLAYDGIWPVFFLEKLDELVNNGTIKEEEASDLQSDIIDLLIWSKVIEDNTEIEIEVAPFVVAKFKRLVFKSECLMIKTKPSAFKSTHLLLCKTEKDHCEFSWKTIGSVDNSENRNWKNVSLAYTFGFTEGRKSNNTLAYLETYLAVAGIDEEVLAEARRNFLSEVSVYATNELKNSMMVFTHEKASRKDEEVTLSAEPMVKFALRRLSLLCECIGFESDDVYPFPISEED